MEDYNDYPAGHKDHHYWPTVKWDADYITKEEREAAKAKAEPVKPAKVAKPQYRDWEVVERDGSITYYSAMITKPVVINGYMV
jgi:hypothetical protein